MHKPYAVICVHRSSEVVAYYEDLMAHSRVDLSHLRENVDRAQAEGSTENVVSRHATRAEADAAAARCYSTPGITYHAEYFDC